MHSTPNPKSIIPSATPKERSSAGLFPHVEVTELEESQPHPRKWKGTKTPGLHCPPKGPLTQRGLLLPPSNFNPNQQCYAISHSHPSKTEVSTKQKCSKRRPHFRSGPSVVQDHCVHPHGPSGHDIYACTYTFRELKLGMASAFTGKLTRS